MHSKRKIPDSWRTGWKAKACTSFALYLKVFKNHLYYLWHVRVLSIKPCLQYTASGAYWKATEKFPGVGAFDHYSLGVGNLIDSLDFMLRVAPIPRGVINHDEDKHSCIQSERYPIRGGLAKEQKLPQALFCIWRYSRAIYIIFGMSRVLS